MRRLLILLAVLCGRVWGFLVVCALTGPETWTAAKMRTAIGVSAFLLACRAAAAGKR